MRRMLVHAAVAPIGFFVGNQLAFVFDDARALGNASQSKHAAAMDRRIAHDNTAAFFLYFSPFWLQKTNSKK